MIEFLLNKTSIQLDDVAPTLSVLDWLRTEKALTGSKEGCASGDCGACTVLVGKKQAGRIKYKTINSCLLLVGNLHGSHLVTVEGLLSFNADDATLLHPVQQAMVECHASQCGFCTPGFIMSMYGLYINELNYPGREVVVHALGGNLCRCTGYQPILKACERMYEVERPIDRLIEAGQHFFQKRKFPVGHLKQKHKSFFLPTDMNSLVALKEQFPNAKLIAGGTDLSLAFSQALEPADQIISLNCVDELTTVSTESGLTIGAASTYSMFYELLVEQYPEVKEMLQRLGSQQIRNAGTLGGSLGNASPIGDPAPLLIALNAKLKLTSIEGERWLPVDEFFISYRETQLAANEVISAVHIPKRVENFTLACYKISKRMEDDISSVLMVIGFVNAHGLMQQVRSGFGGMAAIPMRSQKMEQALELQPLSDSGIERAQQVLAEEFKPMTDVRSSAHYRIEVCQNLLSRLVIEQQTDTPTRVAHAAL